MTRPPTLVSTGEPENETTAAMGGERFPPATLSGVIHTRHGPRLHGVIHPIDHKKGKTTEKKPSSV